MKNILCFLLTIFLFSCATLDSIVDMRSTLERNDNAQQILDQLNDSELKKGKIFVLSWHREFLLAEIRVNEEVFSIKREEIQSFELKDGNNSLSTYLTAFGDEVGNCNKEPYVFNTNDFEDDETHYFILIEAPKKCLLVLVMFMLQRRHSITKKKTLDQDGKKVGLSTTK
jgi:hypothetical protein